MEAKAALATPMRKKETTLWTPLRDDQIFFTVLLHGLDGMQVIAGSR